MHKAIVINSYEEEACALLLMHQHRSSFLPAVDDNDHLEGAISLMTLAHRVVQKKREVDIAFMEEAFVLGYTLLGYTLLAQCLTYNS